ncbi:hypothetical protein [Brotaphodocola sp.]|uniref:hypothetical protein n=1 Tax=Brotaphodocola sp. TaxID=3073577 RepID=UPI003D7DD991
MVDPAYKEIAGLKIPSNVIMRMDESNHLIWMNAKNAKEKITENLPDLMVEKEKRKHDNGRKQKEYC